MNYPAHPVPSYENLKGTHTRAHEGSQSHTGTEGNPHTSIPGSGGQVGEGTPTRLEHGAPHGMDM